MLHNGNDNKDINLQVDSSLVSARLDEMPEFNAANFINYSSGLPTEQIIKAKTNNLRFFEPRRDPNRLLVEINPEIHKVFEAMNKKPEIKTKIELRDFEKEVYHPGADGQNNGFTMKK